MVVGYRIPRKETIAGRSHCEACGETLVWWQLLPLVSFLVLKGKCRHCSSKIGLINPISEVLMGGLFTSSAVLLKLRPETLVSWTLICLLFTITVADLVYQIIPNKVLGFFFLVGVIERIVIPQNDLWWYPLAGFLAGFLPLFLLGLLNEQSVGGGDIKLFAVVGIFLGPIGVLLSLFLSAVIAIIGYVIILIYRQKRQKIIPFGPSIAIGSWIIYQFISGQLDQFFLLISR